MQSCAARAVSRVRQELIGATVAPKTRETLAELQGRRPQKRVSGDSATLSHSQSACRVHLRAALLSPEEAPTKCSKCVWVMQRRPVCCFGQQKTSARAEEPELVTREFMTAPLTAFRESDGGARGVATGTSFCRLVAKTLARQFGKVVE